MRPFLAIATLFCAGYAQAAPPDFDIQLDTVRKGYDGKTCWVHPRAGIIPGETPSVVMTMQKLTVTGSDLFSPLCDLRTDDLGKTWTAPRELPKELGYRKEPDGVTHTICDFYPQWHAATRKLLAIGHTVRYKNDKVIAERKRETAYSVYDAETKGWSDWATLEMPAEARFFNNGAGCVQRVDLADGTILLPTYFKGKGEPDYRVAVLKCAFDGRKLTVMAVGDELRVHDGRGFYEPSIAAFKGRYYLTLRNDTASYVCAGDDGLRFGEPRKWLFDDGADLGTYNTQQHWVTHPEGLFLLYTRKGANNDHVFRHRAPLFIGRVDADKMRVIRATERILVPERGARLGNFGVTVVSPEETWVTVSEWMQTNPPQRILPVDNKWGSDNSVFTARIIWKREANFKTKR